MNRMATIAILVTISTLPGTTGCDRSGTVPLTSDDMDLVRLRDVGELYREYQLSAKKPPRSLKDFQKMGDAGSPTGFSAIRSGHVVVSWGATLPDTEPEPTSPPSDLVLAYAKGVPENGGPVLMLDRRIRTFTVEEFQTAKFAGDGIEKAKSKS